MKIGADVRYVFLYDADGPMALRVINNGAETTYYYVKNLQGDITAIVNKAGKAVVEYTYDAWGNVLSIEGEYKNGLGLRNPLLYRGYVYDRETKLYYLQSRYYDPAVGRFINADSYASTGQGIIGHNMFAYCASNPINNKDISGNMCVAIKDFGGGCSLGLSTNGFNPNGSFSPGSSGSLGREIVDYFTNEDEAEVVDDDFIDFYKGVPVIKVPFMESSAFSFGIIFMGTEAHGESIVRHEYGHCVHLSQIGITNYAIKVVIPSVIGYWSNVPIDEYYSQPWEYIAEVLGNVNRSDYQYSENAESNAKKYWIFTMLP